MAAHRFAEGTEVSVDKTRLELERLVARHGATGWLYGWQDGTWNVAWRMHGRQVRFRIVGATDEEMAITPGGRRRLAKDRRAAADAETRRRWRALLLIVKAKLELVASGEMVFEDEFLAHVVVPTGETVSQWIKPQLAQAYTSGQMPALLPGSTGVTDRRMP